MGVGRDKRTLRNVLLFHFYDTTGAWLKTFAMILIAIVIWAILSIFITLLIILFISSFVNMDKDKEKTLALIIFLCVFITIATGGFYTYPTAHMFKP